MGGYAKSVVGCSNKRKLSIQMKNYLMVTEKKYDYQKLFSGYTYIIFLLMVLYSCNNEVNKNASIKPFDMRGGLTPSRLTIAILKNFSPKG